MKPLTRDSSKDHPSQRSRAAQVYWAPVLGLAWSRTTTGQGMTAPVIACEVNAWAQATAILVLPAACNGTFGKDTLWLVMSLSGDCTNLKLLHRLRGEEE